ncbi:MAG: diadenosine tetraphosphate hydrolase [Phycisphaerales bacterium]|nr:diadenosine tetraphosphate hydrolase [Phycisphaerales bacterium]
MATTARLAWRSDRWLLRHHAHPAPMPGWFLLDSIRHIGGVADLDPTEEREFSRALGGAMRAIRDALKIPRIYVVMFGEGAKHLHAHLIPRDGISDSTKAWAIADLYRAVESRQCSAADPVEVAAIVREVALRMRGFTLS